MDETLERVELMIMGFQLMIDEIEMFKKGSRVVENHELSIHSKKALDGLNGIVSHLNGVHSALLEEKGVVKVPVVDRNRPQLKIVGGTDYAKRTNLW